MQKRSDIILKKHILLKMKSLYESILSSTNSGVYSIVNSWCNKSIHGPLVDSIFTVDGKNILLNPDNKYTFQVKIIPNEKLPAGFSIKGNDNCVLGVSDFDGKMSMKQLPDEIGSLTLADGKLTTLDDYTVKVNSLLALNMYNLNDIKNLNVEFNNTRINQLIIRPANFDYNMFKNIKSDTLLKLDISDTRTGEDIIEACKKSKNKVVTDVVSDLFVNMPKLNTVQLKNRTMLSKNNKNEWIFI